MPKMADEEADALDELVTNNPPKESTHKTPSELIGEMVCEKMAGS
jgi:hypothetical protein